ncbi:MAG: LacI family DNA-binding transcriptional regulator [Spirochaetales bacterium]|nr:LacI family DNA-binding transcriptional regulator [Spirochaetales bacterium]
MKSTMVTRAEVARRAGVSPMTVTRVMANDPHVTDETRQLVLEVVRELGYYPSVSARAIRGNNMNVLSVTTPTQFYESLFQNTFFQTITHGISQSCFTNRFDLLITFLDNPGHSGDPEGHDFLRPYLENKCDGLLFIALSPWTDQLERIEREKIPCVAIYSPFTGTSLTTVNVDDRLGAFTAVRHLTDNGHRDIALVNGPPRHMAAIARERGYRDALEAAGIPFRPELTTSGEFLIEVGYRNTLELLDRATPITAIFCGNDDLAFGALKALAEKGLRVPENVSLVGFDDVDGARLSNPPLTTIAQPLKAIGRIGAELLIERIRNPDAPVRDVIVPLTLVERASVRKLN